MSGEGLQNLKNPLCCRLHLTRMVRAKRKMEMEMEMEALLPGNVKKAEGCK